MNVLLIGAGAVGQSYGRHFQLGGAEVSYFVRPHHRAEAEAGFALYPLNERKAAKGPVRFDGFGVLTDLDEVAKTTWDAVMLCISSTALRRGTWLDELLAAIGDAIVISLTPGPEDNAYVLKRVPAERAVFGLIGLSSYPGPLEGEELPSPGMVYWIPPGTKMAFSGPRAPTQSIVRVLSAGGLASKQVKNTAVTTAFAGPVLQMCIVALELVGWKFSALRADKAMMRESYRATREAFLLAEKTHGVKTPIGLRLIRPWTLRAVMRLIPLVVPFDMERFFEKHFTKVGDQTEDTLATYVRLAKNLGTSHQALDRLREQLESARAGSKALQSETN